MNFINKLERKFGKYAIHNLMYYVVILYVVGTLLYLINPSAYYYLYLDGYYVMHGQVWRCITFLMSPLRSNNIIFAFIMIYMYFMIGTNLERQWGAFRFNLYFFSGVIGHVLAAILLYLVTNQHNSFNLTYLNLSLFLAFAATYPDIEFLLLFVLPVKAKWLGILNAVFLLYQFMMGSLSVKAMIVMAMANFIIFFLVTRRHKRISPKQVYRKKSFHRAASQPKHITKHKCAICGRTDQDGEDLEFRFCSKCDGNYEYCQDHLFTHEHVKKSR